MRTDRRQFLGGAVGGILAAGAGTKSTSPRAAAAARRGDMCQVAKRIFPA